MRYTMLVLVGIQVGLLMFHSVTANFPFDALAGDILRIMYGTEGPPNAAQILAVMTRTTGDGIKHHGYPYEKHMITTDDGYLLEMHRIPNTKSSNGSKSVPIIITPGMLTDSGCFILNGVENSPAFIFSDAGYDVWLHNNRGTRYGRKHKTLSPDFQKEFWNYSFHEMGVHDLPAAIDYVTSTTQSKEVYLMGHSMGTTLMTIFLAEKPEYSDKVKAAFLLAPAIYVGGTQTQLAHQLQFISEIFLFFMDDMEVLPFTNNTLVLAASLLLSPIGKAARVLMKTPFSSTTDTQDLLLEKISKGCSGTNGKVLRHYLQMVNHNNFARFDYGAEGNMAAYGKETPPDYKLDTIEVPVSLFYADGDNTVVPDDIIRASTQFKQLIGVTQVGDETFDHWDFIVLEDVKFRLYDTILDQMSHLESDKRSQTMTNLTYTIIFIIFMLITIGQLMLFARKHADRANKVLY